MNYFSLLLHLQAITHIHITVLTALKRSILSRCMNMKRKNEPQMTLFPKFDVKLHVV